MFIELPSSLEASADPAVDLPLDFERLETFTMVLPRRGMRPADPGSRIRLALPRDTRQWPWHAGVAQAAGEPLTFTRSDPSAAP